MTTMVKRAQEKERKNDFSGCPYIFFLLSLTHCTGFGKYGVESQRKENDEDINRALARKLSFGTCICVKVLHFLTRHSFLILLLDSIIE
jgi:hypothetical protein